MSNLCVNAYFTCVEGCWNANTIVLNCLRSVTTFEYNGASKHTTLAWSLPQEKSEDFTKDLSSKCCRICVTPIVPITIHYQWVALTLITIQLSCGFTTYSYYEPVFFRQSQASLIQETGVAQTGLSKRVSLIFAPLNLNLLTSIRPCLFMIPGIGPIPNMYVLSRIASNAAPIAATGLTRKLTECRAGSNPRRPAYLKRLAGLQNTIYHCVGHCSRLFDQVQAELIPERCRPKKASYTVDSTCITVHLKVESGHKDCYRLTTAKLRERCW